LKFDKKNFGLSVDVQNNNVDKAIRKLKKKMNNDGKLQNVRARQQYEKPSEVRKRAKAAAKKRWNKKVSSQLLPQKNY